MVAAPLAAMFDPAEFNEPWKFKTGRCLNKYIHYGPERYDLKNSALEPNTEQNRKGPRYCFGDYIANAVIFESPVRF